MAVASNALTANTDSTDSTVYTTASVSPGADRLLLLAVLSTRNDSVNPAPPSSVTGNGLTWVQVNTINYDSSLGTRSTITVFRALGASPSAGAVTINFAETQHSCSWALVEFSGVDTSGTNGSGAVVQSVINNVSGTNTLTGTLAAFGSVDNATYGCFGSNASSGWTAGSGFTEIYDVIQTDTLLTSLLVEFRNDNDTTVDATSGGSGDLGVIAIEIKASSGTVISRTLRDDASVTDSPLRSAQDYRLAQDLLSVTSSVSSNRQRNRVLSDAANALDIVRRREVQLFRRIPELLTVFDSLVVTVTLAGSEVYDRVLRDSVDLTDSMSRSVALFRKVQDTFLMSDQTVRGKVSFKQLLDTIAIIDEVSRVVHMLRRIPESADIVDLVIRRVLLRRVVIESASVADLLALSVTSTHEAAIFILSELRREAIVSGVDKIGIEQGLVREAVVSGVDKTGIEQGIKRVNVNDEVE